jgi:Uma2 family endonuclease
MGRRDFRTKREMPMSQSGEAPIYATVADVLARIGVPPERIRMDPHPGTATERDLIQLLRKTKRLYELVDGVLVEKPMGFMESEIACVLISLLLDFVREHDLGLVVGESGVVRLMPGLVRMPDVSYVSWKQLPARTCPKEPIPGLAPDLAIEVLSKSNRRREMQRKRREFFLAGVQLVWFIDPRKRTVTVYTPAGRSSVLAEDQTLDGGEVLPGLAISLKEIFLHVPPASPRPGKRRKPGKS